MLSIHTCLPILISSLSHVRSGLYSCELCFFSLVIELSVLVHPSILCIYGPMVCTKEVLMVCWTEDRKCKSWTGRGSFKPYSKVLTIWVHETWKHYGVRYLTRCAHNVIMSSHGMTETNVTQIGQGINHQGELTFHITGLTSWMPPLWGHHNEL